MYELQKISVQKDRGLFNSRKNNRMHPGEWEQNEEHLPQKEG